MDNWSITIGISGAHNFIYWVLVILIWVMRRPSGIPALPGLRGMLPRQVQIWQEHQAIG